MNYGNHHQPGDDLRLLSSVESNTRCKMVGLTPAPRPRGQGHQRRLRGWRRGRNRSNPRNQAHIPVSRRDDKGVLKRLLDLGLTKGCVFKVIQSCSRGPVLIDVRGTRIALGEGIANRVIVEEVN